MRSQKFTVLLIGIVLCLSVSAHAQQSQVPDVITQFWNKVAKAKTLTFQMRHWTWEENGDIAPKPYFRVLTTYEVSVQKPNNLAIHATPPLEYELKEEAAIAPSVTFTGLIGDNVQISDGKRTLVLSTSLRSYAHKPPIKSLVQADELAEGIRFDYLFDTKPMKGLLPGSPLKAGGYVNYVLRNAKGTAEERYIFDGKTGALIFLSYWDKADDGKMQESERFHFRYWVFNAALPPKTFETRPPNGYRTRTELEREIKAQRPNIPDKEFKP